MRLSSTFLAFKGVKSVDGTLMPAQKALGLAWIRAAFHFVHRVVVERGRLGLQGAVRLGFFRRHAPSHPLWQAQGLCSSTRSAVLVEILFNRHEVSPGGLDLEPFFTKL